MSLTTSAPAKSTNTAPVAQNRPSVRHRLTSWVAAGAIALASLAPAPVAAQTNDGLEQLLGTLAGLAIFGAVIHELSQDQKRDSKSGHVAHPPRWDHGSNKPGKGHGAKGNGGKHSRLQAMPRACLLRVDRADTRFAFARRCLQRNKVALSRLPNQCRTKVMRNGRLRPGYSASCLSRRGYVLEGRG